MSAFQYDPPARRTEFVAYTAAAREVADETTGEVCQYRQQVWVMEYPNVKIAEIKKTTVSGERDSFVNLYVTFDAASAGLRHNFGASIRADDPLAAILEKAAANNVPITLVKETKRRQHVYDSKDEVDQFAPISELRGAKPDNSESNNQSTRKNCSNVLAGACPAGHPEHFILSREITTDPTEWKMLRSNQSGAMSPDPSLWRPGKGGLISVTHSASAAAGNVDVDALAAALTETLGDALAARLSGVLNQRGGPAPARTSTGGERPWEPVFPDGSAKPNSYLLSKERAVLAYALRKLTNMGKVEGDVLADATALKRLLLRTYDYAHKQIAPRLGRGDKSHFETSQWVETVIDHVSLLPGMEHLQLTAEVVDDPDGQGAQWGRAVGDMAVRLEREAMGDVEAYARGQHAAGPASAGSPTSARSAQSPTSPRQTPAPQQPAAPQGPPAAPHGGTQQPAPASTPRPAQSPADSAAADAAAADPWAQSSAGEKTFRSAAELRAHWETLITEAIPGGTASAAACDPLLVSVFGTADLTVIDYDDFYPHLTKWRSAPADFSAQAQHAYAAAQS